MTYIMKNNKKISSNKAKDIDYDNTNTSLESTNIQDAINELESNIGGLSFGTDGDGNYGYYGADGSLVPFSSGAIDTFSWGIKSIDLGFKPSHIAIMVKVTGTSKTLCCQVDSVGDYIFMLTDTVYTYMKQGYIKITDSGFSVINVIAGVFSGSNAQYIAVK